MEILTAKQARVQDFMNPYMFEFSNKEKCRQIKNERLDLLERHLLEEQDLYITELFPRKQREVLDHILYITSVSGISKVSINTLVNKTEVSRRTVCSAVSNLKLTNQFIVGRLGDGNAGKYIFVDKLHPNFKEIMSDVFKLDVNTFINENEVAATIEPELNDNEVEESIQVIENPVKDAIKKEIDNEEVLSVAEQKEKITEYSTNEYQRQFFDFILSLPKVPTVVLNSAYKIALSVGSNATLKEFTVASQVIFDFISDLERGRLEVNTSIRALFEHAFINRLKDSQVTSSPTESPTEVQDIANLDYNSISYNWIDEREDRENISMNQHQPENNVIIPIWEYNWLDNRD